MHVFCRIDYYRSRSAVILLQVGSSSSMSKPIPFRFTWSAVIHAPPRSFTKNCNPPPPLSLSLTHTHAHTLTDPSFEQITHVSHPLSVYRLCKSRFFWLASWKSLFWPPSVGTFCMQILWGGKDRPTSTVLMSVLERRRFGSTTF